MRVVTCHTPLWFGTSEIIMQLIFTLVTFFIAFYAYRVYKISRQRPSLLFGVAFLGLSGAYFTQALLNYLILAGVQTPQLLPGVMHVSVTSFQLSILAVLSHMLFKLLGLSLLAYITLKERGLKIFVLFFLMGLVGLAFSKFLSLTFFLITSILLAFITLQYYQRHARKPTTNSLLVFMGFGLVFLGNIQLAFASTLSLLYISGHFIVLFGYVLLLMSLLRVVMK